MNFILIGYHTYGIGTYFPKALLFDYHSLKYIHSFIRYAIMPFFKLKHICITIVNKQTYITEWYIVWSANNSLVSDRSTVTDVSWSCDSTKNTALNHQNISVYILFPVVLYQYCETWKYTGAVKRFWLRIITSICLAVVPSVCELVFRPVPSYSRCYYCTESVHELVYINTLRTGLLNCLNARSRGLTFRHRASCI